MKKNKNTSAFIRIDSEAAVIKPKDNLKNR